MLFSENQQFILFSDTGVLTPGFQQSGLLSNYQMDRFIEPVDAGTNINFVSKTPGYTVCLAWSLVVSKKIHKCWTSLVL